MQRETRRILDRVALYTTAAAVLAVIFFESENWLQLKPTQTIVYVSIIAWGVSRAMKRKRP